MSNEDPGLHLAIQHYAPIYRSGGGTGAMGVMGAGGGMGAVGATGARGGAV